MAAIAGRGILGLLGTAGVYGLYETATQYLQQAPKPVQKEFMSFALNVDPKKIAMGVTTVGALALTYYLVKKREPLPAPEIPITINTGKTEESIIPGSDLSERPTPTCQGYVAKKIIDKIKGETLEIIGCCFRTSFGLWVPAHVIGPDHDQCYIVGRKQTRMGKNGITEMYTPSISLAPYFKHITDAEQFGAEIINIPINTDDMSKLGLSVAKFTVLGDKQMVTIVGPGGKSSMGELLCGATMGSLRYHGSTQAGFSGAPYMLSGKVVGVHLHGGPGGNGGQEVAYLNQCYKIAMNYVEESSNFYDSGAKIMELAFKKNQEVQVEEQGDFFVYRDVGGHYHRVQRRTYYDLKEKYSDLPRNQQFEDWSDESSEASYYQGDPEEYDRFHRRGKYSEESKKPFLSQGSKSSKQGPPTRRNQKKQPSTQKRIELLQKRLAKLQNLENRKQCAPQTLPPPAPSTLSPSSSPADTK